MNRNIKTELNKRNRAIIECGSNRGGGGGGGDDSDGCIICRKICHKFIRIGRQIDISRRNEKITRSKNAC